MRKLVYGIFVAVGILSLAASCETESVDEQAELHSPDPDEHQRPGGGGDD
ncbi:hypothetical protein [Flagellimonas nanhaiensis]|nr:hypothetical protein [Allomuricauda nanhaiensis]